ncbi:hypothetical protein FACS1894216_22600 [Synergistales bacterium]|nr:hypothetical protein FACS1894216_22600 [Synergistales bacterium]
MSCEAKFSVNMEGAVSVYVENGCLKVIGEIPVAGDRGAFDAFIAAIIMKLLGDSKKPKLQSFSPAARELAERDASIYIGRSRAFLKKCRLEGSTGGRPRGPKFTRESARCVRYPIDELDKWLAGRARYETNCEIVSNNGE